MPQYSTVQGHGNMVFLRFIFTAQFYCLFINPIILKTFTQYRAALGLGTKPLGFKSGIPSFPDF